MKIWVYPLTPFLQWFAPAESAFDQGYATPRSLEAVATKVM
jgi:hypothetical protein